MIPGLVDGALMAFVDDINCRGSIYQTLKLVLRGRINVDHDANIVINPLLFISYLPTSVSVNKQR
eukprot:scaffold177009_cov27-Prasinocladus_malaysianus.AAC.2